MIDNIPDWVLWVAVIFLAGVVGQFGKSLTLRFLDLFSKGNEDQEVPPLFGKANGGKPDSDLDGKEEKKRKKAELKRAKKEAKEQAKSGG